MKLRLTGRGFENYTGQMGIHYFKDGVSVYDVLRVDGMRLAGTIGAEWVDGSPANVGDVYAANLQVQAPTDLRASRTDPMAMAVGFADATQVIDHSQQIAELQFKATGLSDTDAKATVKIVKKSTKQNASASESTVSTIESTHERFTREQLEAIVDEQGFVGLRSLGSELGVKSGSINGLIEEILEVAGADENK